MQSFVYFLLSADTMRMKIGVSEDPDARSCELQIGNGSHLELIGWVKGDLGLERDLHRAMRPWHAKGEWFHVDDNIVAIVRAACEDDERRRLLSQLEASVRHVLPFEYADA